MDIEKRITVSDCYSFYKLEVRVITITLNIICNSVQKVQMIQHLKLKNYNDRTASGHHFWQSSGKIGLLFLSIHIISHKIIKSKY